MSAGVLMITMTRARDVPHPYPSPPKKMGAVVDYRVQVVEDWELPQGTDWVITHELGRARLLVKRGQFERPDALCRVLERAWEASAGYPALAAAG